MYPKTEVLPDGTIISMTYCDLTDNGKYDPQIVCLRYRMPELDNLAGIIPEEERR